MSRTINLSRNPMEVPGTTFEYVEMHAFRDMQRTAAIVSDVAISYGKVCHDVMVFACALHERGVRHGHRLAVNVVDGYAHWITLLAAEVLGAATCSVHATEISAALVSIARNVNFWVGVEPTIAVERSESIIPVDPDWSSAAYAAPVDENLFDRLFHPIAWSEPQRLRRSSGTTGGMKLMVSNRGVEEGRMKGYADFIGLTSESKVLVSKSFIVSASYLTANLCLRLGAMVVFDAGTSKLDQIRKYKISHIRLFQDQLLQLLDEIDQTHAAKPSDLTVVLGGASVSQALWSRTLDKLATRIECTYSTNECGSIGFMGPDGQGVVRAGVVLQVVDEKDQPLPWGQAGRIRVRTPSQISGYLDNPDMSAQNFREGWFYTGDLGILRSERQLKLVGRVDDVLNIAGYKHSCQVLEGIVIQVAGVKEVCATSVRGVMGVDKLAFVLVLHPGFSQKDVAAQVVSRFPVDMHASMSLYFSEKLLRTESGKLRRKAIGDMLPVG